MAIDKTRLFIAGHRGMVGSALVRQLENEPNIELVLRSRDELDLTNQADVLDFFKAIKIDQVYLAAARVGGIHANNTYPAEFIYQNLMIQANVINSAFESGVKKLLFLGSSCIYPRDADQPMKEGSLLSGKLEPTNEPYAIAKIAGIKLCESYNRQYGERFGIDYRSVMPTNLYGPGDNYHPENSHVIPALIRRFHEAKQENSPYVKIWGTGAPRREFLHVDDMARACVFLMNLETERYQENTGAMCNHINVGSGADVTIKELAEIVQAAIGYSGELTFDRSFPDGAPRKFIESTLLNNLGWRPQVDLISGVAATYRDFMKEQGLLN